MNKVLFFLAVVLLTVCCAENKKEPTNISVDYSRNASGLKVIMIDSCEYVQGYRRIAHKGNCKFCAERRKREMQSIVEQINK